MCTVIGEGPVLQRRLDLKHTVVSLWGRLGKGAGNARFKRIKFYLRLLQGAATHTHGHAPDITKLSLLCWLGSFCLVLFCILFQRVTQSLLCETARLLEAMLWGKRDKHSKSLLKMVHNY